MLSFHPYKNKQNNLFKILVNSLTRRLQEMEIDADMADLNLSEENNLNSIVFESVLQTPNCKDEFIEKSSSEVSENNSSESNPVAPRRSMRRKIAPLKETEKQRTVSTGNRFLDSSNLNDLKKYYTNKSTKKLSSALETIFEYNVETKSGNITTVSSRKYKRALSFGDCSSINIGKIRKRQLKAKKLCKAKRKKVSMKIFLSKLKDLDSEECSDSQC